MKPAVSGLTSLYLVVLLSMLSSARAQNADINMLRSINLHRNKSLDGAMNDISGSVYPITVAVPVAELIAGYAGDNKQMKINGWQTIAGLGANTIIVVGLKYTVNRKCPYNTYPDLDPYKRENDPSFPSGHTSSAFCTATSLSICFPKWYVIAPGYAWALATGYSRMHLGEHYPTDVLVGAAIGAGSAWLAYKGNQWLQKKKRENHDSHD
ncbi:MAG: phosphoesterase PA-phosphatase related protein [Flavipsychrobacter sp.]|nr:phosphoesterase PA-phosphatase related protein [Flavipsychrobacter sp.]